MQNAYASHQSMHVMGRFSFAPGLGVHVAPSHSVRLASLGESHASSSSVFQPVS
jgi:hypothetical protein